MELNRRDMLKGTGVVAATGSLMAFGSTGTASAASHSTLRAGAHGPEVLALQRRLSSLGYWLGGADGSFGDLTRQAVMSIQKVAGLLRDGECGPLTWARVDAGLRPRARSSRGHVVEVNKATQTLLIVDSGAVRRIYNTSTGSGQRYFQDKTKTWHMALTPSGSFRVFRQVNKWDDGPLGKLYRPKYFNGGIAVHGLASVPAYPASHGCCRVSLPAMDNLWGAGGIAVGTSVRVY